MRKVPRIVSVLGAAAAACGLIVPVLMSASPPGATPSGGLPNGLVSTPINLTSNNGLRYGEPEIAVNPQDPNNIVYYVMSQQLTFACEAAHDPNCVNDPLTGAARDALIMSAEDAAALGLANGDPIEVRSDNGQSLRCRVRIDAIKPRNVQAFWPECNVLVRRRTCEVASGVPDYNAIIEIEPLGMSAAVPVAAGVGD